jgi:hypothetical protein
MGRRRCLDGAHGPPTPTLPGAIGRAVPNAPVAIAYLPGDQLQRLRMPRGGRLFARGG